MESGIVALRNLKTDRVYLFFSKDIKKDCVDMRFNLDLGMHPCRSLQKDYTETGLEVFRFDTVMKTDDPEKLREVRSSFTDFYD